MREIKGMTWWAMSLGSPERIQAGTGSDVKTNRNEISGGGKSEISAAEM
jgi:hypothetical protein